MAFYLALNGILCSADLTREARNYFYSVYFYFQQHVVLIFLYLESLIHDAVKDYGHAQYRRVIHRLWTF